MQFENKQLLEFLKQVEEELEQEIEIIAVGGTAMTLLELKTSTIDIDFNLNHEDKKLFKKALEKIHHGFKIDLYSDGLIFSQQLPDDYIIKAIPIKTNLNKIKLFALHPIDIVASKTGRLNERGLEDIEACIKKF